MPKIAKIFLWILMVLLLAAMLVGGVLYALYQNAEAQTAPEFSITLQGEALSQSGGTWITPVLSGLLQKTAAVQPVAAPAWPVITQQTVTLALPANAAAMWRVSKDGTTIFSGNTAAGGTTVPITFPENGAYSLEVTITQPEQSNKSYGTVTYAADFTVQVEPQIHYSSVRLLQGDVLRVSVDGVLDAAVPTIETNLSLTAFAKQGTSWVTYVGVMYNREPGTYDITVTIGDKTETQTVTVVHRDFSRQDMVMSSATANATNNNPNAAPQWRNEIWPLFEIADAETYWEGTFIWPKKGNINTEYGLFRYTTYTEGGRDVERHAGIDISGSTGDPVVAPAAGRVVFAGELIYTGNTVVIEHGNGLKSFLFHMDSLAVEKGQRVTQGQQIGTVGSTGYSTGPHLHYEVRIGNQSVDPMQLFDGTSGLYYVQ